MGKEFRNKSKWFSSDGGENPTPGMLGLTSLLGHKAVSSSVSYCRFLTYVLAFVFSSPPSSFSFVLVFKWEAAWKSVSKSQLTLFAIYYNAIVRK